MQLHQAETCDTTIAALSLPSPPTCSGSPVAGCCHPLSSPTASLALLFTLWSTFWANSRPAVYGEVREMRMPALAVPTGTCVQACLA